MDINRGSRCKGGIYPFLDGFSKCNLDTLQGFGCHLARVGGPLWGLCPLLKKIKFPPPGKIPTDDHYKKLFFDKKVYYKRLLHEWAPCTILWNLKLYVFKIFSFHQVLDPRGKLCWNLKIWKIIKDGSFLTKQV